MTPVVFHFLAPDGVPLSNTTVEIQLTRSTFDDEVSGVVMPRLVTAVTDDTGHVTVPLQPGDMPYVVTVNDSRSDAALAYRFYVPVLEAPSTEVRLQDIIVDGTVSTTPWDTAALQIILEAKANAVSAALNAEASEAMAQEFADAAEESYNMLGNQLVEAKAARDGAVAAQLVSEAARNTAVTKAGEANTSAANALASEGKASTSETNSAGSETRAKASENASKTSETNAKTSETNSKTSETNAKTSETNAGLSATAAATHASNLASAEFNAKQSETNARNSETNALAYRNTAGTHASAAETSRQGALNAEQNALSYSDSAILSAGTATTKASEASGSAAQAAISATNLNTAVTNATNAKNAAEGARDVAIQKATEASGSATTAEQWAKTAQAAAEDTVAGQVRVDWLATSGVQEILNKPMIPDSPDDIGLGNVENKSSATIRSELTVANITNPLAGVLKLEKNSFPQVALKHTGAPVDGGQWANWINADFSYSIGTQLDNGTGTAKITIDRNGVTRVLSNILDVENSAATPVRIGVNGQAGVTRYFNILTASKLRWGFGANTEAEAGSNQGSNFVIARYNDAGNYIDTTFSIGRSNGDTTIYKSLFIHGGLIALNAGAGVAKVHYFSTVGSRRWISGVNSDAETSGNAGSDYFWSRHADDGIVIDTPMKISRATGSVTLTKPLLFPNTGTSAVAVDAGNNDIINVNNIKFWDAGTNEGLEWPTWKIYESPNDLSNANGNLQIVRDGARRFTFDTNGDFYAQNNIKGAILTLVGDRLENHAQDSDTATLGFNYTGYNGGVTRFRDFKVFDGKQAVVFTLTGSNKAAAFAGNVTAPAVTTTGKTTAAMFVATDYDGIRIKTNTGVAGKAAVLRNDGNSFYLLMTNEGQADSAWNSLRPLTVDMANGNLTMGHNVSILGSLINPKIKNYEEVMYTHPAVVNGAVTVDLNNGTYQRIITNANLTITLPNSVAGKSFTLEIEYGGVHTISFSGGTDLRWANGTAPKSTSVAGKVDLVVFTQNGIRTYGRTGGSNY